MFTNKTILILSFKLLSMLIEKKREDKPTFWFSYKPKKRIIVWEDWFGKAVDIGSPEEIAYNNRKQKEKEEIEIEYEPQYKHKPDESYFDDSFDRQRDDLIIN